MLTERKTVVKKKKWDLEIIDASRPNVEITHTRQVIGENE